MRNKYFISWNRVVNSLFKNDNWLVIVESFLSTDNIAKIGNCIQSTIGMWNTRIMNQTNLFKEFSLNLFHSLNTLLLIS